MPFTPYAPENGCFQYDIVSVLGWVCIARRGGEACHEGNRRSEGLRRLSLPQRLSGQRPQRYSGLHLDKAPGLTPGLRN